MRSRSFKAALVLAAMLVGGAARADELPAANQALLLLRVLAYDRNLAVRSGGKVEIAVAYKKGGRDSESAGDEVVHALTELAHRSVVAGMAVTVRALPLARGEELSQALDGRRTAAVFVCAGLESEVPAIFAASRAHSVLSASGERAAVEAGLAVGLVSLSGRAGLVVNLPAARLEGADLDSAMLRMAEVLR